MLVSPLRCSNTACRKLLREGGIELLRVVFPSDYELLQSLLTGNIHRAKCPSCGTVVEFDPVVCFFSRPTRDAFLYAPPTANLSGFVERTLSMMRDALGKAPPSPDGASGRVEQVANLTELKEKALATIREPFVQRLAGYMEARAAGEGEELRWLRQNVSGLDANFFTAFQLLLDECFSLQLTVAYREEDGPPTKDRILGEFAVVRTSLVRCACLQAVGDVTEAGRPRTPLLTTFKRLVPACVLDDQQFRDLTDMAETVSERPGTTGEMAYVAECLLAWAAHTSGRTNPRGQYWVGYVVMLEEGIAGGAEGLSDLRVPDEFLKATVDYRHLWDEIAHRLRDESRGDIRTRMAAVGPLTGLADRLGLGDTIAELMRVMIQPLGLNKVPEVSALKLVDALLERLDEEGGVGVFAQAVRHLIAAGKPEAALRAVDRAQTRLEPQKRWQDISHIRSRAAQAFNDLHQHRAVEGLLSDWVARLRRGEWDALPSATRVDLLNELGNSCRYTGRFNRAAALYTEALELCEHADLPDDRRVLLRNLGIVHRDAGRVLDGIRFIRQSLEGESTPLKRSTGLHSLAICHRMLGDTSQSVELIEEALALVRVADSDQPTIYAQAQLRLLITLANLLQKTDPGRAVEALQEARHLADEVLHSPTDGVSCTVLLLKIGEGVFPTEAWKEIATRLADAFESMEAIDSGVERSAAVILAQVLLHSGDRERFGRLIDLVERGAGEGLVRDRWRIELLKSLAALDRGDLPAARSHLQESWRNLVAALGSGGEGSLPLTYLEDRESLQQFTSALAYRLVADQAAPPSYLCLAAELQQSLMQNLDLAAGSESLPRLLERPLAEDWLQADIELLSATDPAARPVAFVQFLWVRGGYVPLLSVKQSGQPIDVHVGDSLEADTVAEAWVEVRYAVAIHNPGAGGDPLAGLPNWDHVSGWLAGAVRAHVPPGAHLCVVPTGGFSHLPLHMARPPAGDRPLILDYTVSYAPSIFTAARLRERRLAEGRGPGWRADRAGNFVVWLTNDDPDVVESFTAHSRRTCEFLRGRGADLVSAEGTGATQAAFAEALGGTQLFHVCCHGVADLDDRTHRLLVSDGKSLPPSDRTARANPRNAAFFLDWDAVGKGRSPAVVLSCACSSAVTSLHTAGERVGFERALFRHGTASFVAPLWDVAVADVHRLTEAVLDHYYSAAGADLAQAVQRTVVDALAGGRATHAAAALALMGDWL